MTHPAQKIVEDALSEIHRTTSQHDLARAMGYLSHGQVSRVMTKVAEGQASYLESYTGDRLVALAAQLPQIAHALHMASQAHGVQHAPIDQTLTRLTVELGNDVATIAQAQADHRLTPAELDQISARLDKLQALMDETRQGIADLRTRRAAR